MKPSLEWLANPEVFKVNRIPAHSDHSCFTSEGNLRQRLDGVGNSPSPNTPTADL